MKTNLSEIIQLHYVLMGKYDEILKSIEFNNSICRFDLDTRIKIPTNSTNNKQFFHPKHLKKSNKNELNFYSFMLYELSFMWSPENFLIMIGIIFTYFSRITKKSNFTTIHVPLLVSQRLTKYFLQLHIRKNLKKLRELYLREIITNQKNELNQNEIENIRKISSDMENFIVTLPSTRKLFASGTSLIFALFGLIPLIGINLNLIEGTKIFYENNQLLFISIVIGLYFGAFMISFPFKHAFKIKRILLLETNLFDYFNDHFSKNENELYNHSIYKIENELYESVETKNLKPLETAFDRIWDILLGLTIIIFVTGFILSLSYDVIISADDFYKELAIYTGVILFIDLFPTWHLIINPYIIQRNRKNHQLV